MPTTRYFAASPSFPSDVTIAAIPRISLESLQNKVERAAKQLYEACIEYGFFALSLSGSEGERLLHDAENMFELTTSTFNLDQAVLEEHAYQPPRNLLGYKRSGLLRTDNGGVDDMEMYTLGQDDIVGNNTPRKNPDSIEAEREACREFFLNAHKVIDTILGCLDEHLGLKTGTLASLCPIDEQSDTSLRLLQSKPQETTTDAKRITLGGHTDIGTITLLFHVVGGLQILPAGRANAYENWQYVKPQPNCALVNIGDTLVEWTGGLLRSSLHRVVAAPGDQAKVQRQSLAYLVRPARNVSMRRLHSNVIPVVRDGEEEDTRTVTDWAAQRAGQIIRGELKPQTHGGRGGMNPA
ncbi:hypothetical protein N0V90_011264 [Kalmusia sp. IMI 367209]|nr:hypothetical protein N0V90_011264 [Kalmusia sp. IMI 367209]